jgi:16S rRNA C967 or C1407 C5-methylase (RsmB/RsmF family)
MHLALHSNEAAPTTVRINRGKTSREELLEKWADSYDVRPCEQSADGIVFEKKCNFYVLPEFKQGLFSVQDEASQLVAALVEASPGDHVLDYCAGSGGKALAFAYQMEGKGQLYLHDIRPRALVEAKQRLARAGIQNSQLVQADSPALKKLKKKCDWVLVDAPCSGTGTLRRNPDMKWRFSGEMVARLVGQQRQIFEQALSFLKPGGTIVYATCSILPQENQEQVEHFVATYDLEMEEPLFQSFPESGKMDGFFACRLRRSI